MTSTSELIKTIADLKKRIAKLEKEMKKHQNFIDKASYHLYSHLLRPSFKKYMTKSKKTSSLSASLQGKKNE